MISERTRCGDQSRCGREENEMRRIKVKSGTAAALTLLMLAGCGNYTLPSQSDSAGNPGAPPASAKSCDQLFTQRAQSHLAFCRNCHVPGGVADVNDGRLFMLSPSGRDDYASLRASWQALGGNNPVSRILLMPSGQDTRSHSGGTPWPKNSAAYTEMAALLQGFDTPKSCELSSAPDTTPELPLLGSARGGHLWDSFCEGNPDSAVLPADPRSLVVPGVNHGKAVYMNAFWQTCQADDKPANCGEQRARVARGYPIVASAGQVGAGSFFSGNSSTSNYAVPASAYAGMWKSVLGLSARPDNFDQLVSERWGMPLSPTRNPYPLAGEDPNKINGGNGQLPMGLTQLRNADGSWTGNLNVTCSICHGGGVGTAADGPGLGAMYGTNSLSDITLMFTDLAKLAPQQGALSVVSQNKVRGTGNITNFQLFGTLEIGGTPAQSTIPYLSIQTQPSTGTEDPPVWWNVGHRPSKFFDGGQVMDSKRIELSFHFPNVPNHGFPPGSTWEADKQWILDHQQDGDAWISSLKSPAWPETRLGAIDTALAQQGAILFHSKNLWDASLNNAAPKPDGGNGSCASCHGAYSPRYVNDPTYLDSPALEGIAAYIVPETVIKTDSRRLDGNSQVIAEAARSAWFAYNDGPYNAAGIPLCADQNDTALRGNRALGYLAPPLYGVWATAPYFHNGAVPSVWEVLKPSDRHDLWRRQSSEPRADQAGQVVMGFRSDLAAYDAQKLGWNYDVLACGVTGTMPYIDCGPAGTQTLQDVLNLIYANGGLIWNLANLPIMNSQQLEDRKIYNTHMYSQSNAGHEFTAVLTDQERRALIEYLKTL
jgi:mono/diheme cytochrome c family protein